MSRRLRTQPAWRSAVTDLIRHLPRVLLAVTVGTLAVALDQHAKRSAHGMEALATAMVAVYLIWLLAEAGITLRSAGEPAAERLTLPAYALARCALAIAAMVGPVPSAWSWWRVGAAALFAAGVLLRLSAIRTLGRWYSHHVVRQTGHEIVRTGPYRLVRHPAYAGMLVAHIGLVGVFTTPVSAGLLAVLGAVLVWRIRVEERELLLIPGYVAYRAGRARLIPGVW